MKAKEIGAVKQQTIPRQYLLYQSCWQSVIPRHRVRPLRLIAIIFREAATRIKMLD